jgi:hypothetical protein
MTINATVNNNATINATVNTNDNNPVVKILIPGPAGPAGPAGSSGIGTSDDVDISQLDDGSMLMYSGSSEKWVAKNDLEPETGTLILSGGNF